jgi:hypothetical protein
MRLEVDVHAAERRAPLVTARDEGREFRLQAVDAGDLVWVSVEILGEPEGASARVARALDTDVVRDGRDALSEQQDRNRVHSDFLPTHRFC